MPTTKSVSVRLTAWIMALFPVSLAVLFHTGLRPVPLAIEAPVLPALAFHQYAVDLRTIRPSAVVEASYVFHNRGAEPVRITKMEPTCGCLVPRLQGVRDGVIEPGDQARIVVRMQPANSTPGPHEYGITVKYTDPQPRETQLILKLDIPPTLWVTPPALVVYHPAGSEPTRAKFNVTDGRGKRFEITDLSINTDLVEAAIGETSRSETGNFQQDVHTVIAGSLPPGRTEVVLRIMTSDPEIPELRVPLLLQGEATAATAEADQTLDHERPKDARHAPAAAPQNAK